MNILRFLGGLTLVIFLIIIMILPILLMGFYDRPLWLGTYSFHLISFFMLDN